MDHADHANSPHRSSTMAEADYGHTVEHAGSREPLEHADLTDASGDEDDDLDLRTSQDELIGDLEHLVHQLAAGVSPAWGLAPELAADLAQYITTSEAPRDDRQPASQWTSTSYWVTPAASDLPHSSSLTR